MNNWTKWLIAIPFSINIAFVVPGIIAGDFFWFSNHWSDTIYVLLSGGMWMVATAFVDLNRPRERPDLANRLIPLGLILSVIISVSDRVFWIASALPHFVQMIGLIISLAAIVLGIQARQALGQSYTPRASQSGPFQLIRQGPYQWIRHPLYLAAITWIIGWPLIITSLLGSLTGLFFLLPAIQKRIIAEELSLLQTFGKEYAEYQDQTWRLLPFIY